MLIGHTGHVKLIDFDNPERNHFLAINQFRHSFSADVGPGGRSWEDADDQRVAFGFRFGVVAADA